MKVELDTDGTTEEIELRQLREEDRLGQKWVGEVFVFRDDFQQTSAQTGVTEVTVLDGTTVKFSGRLNDVNWEQSLAVLVCDSWEEDADEAPLATGANSLGTKFEERYGNASSETIFTDSVDNVPNLTIGDVAADASNVTHDIVFSNASQREKIRTLELGDPFFVTYNYDKSVDLTSHPGTDRTGTTLSPTSDNVEGDITVVDDGFEDGYTDLLVLGAGGGGNDQISTERELVSNPDRRKEKRVSYKNITRQSYLEDVAYRVQAELQKDFTQIELTIRDLSVDVGDEFTVVKEEEGINNTFYVWDYERTLSSVDKYDVILSTRTKFRTDTESEILTSIDDYETAKNPPTVFLNGGGGNRSPVGPNNNWEMTQAYPGDVLYERNVELKIKGRNYRSFSSGTQSGGGTTQTSTDNQDPKGSVPSSNWNEFGTNTEYYTNTSLDDTSWTNLETNSGEGITVNNATELSMGFSYFNQDTVSEIRVRIYNETQNSTVCETRHTLSSETSEIMLTAYDEDLSDGDKYELQARITDGQTSATLDYYLLVRVNGLHNHTVTVPDHTHAPQAGIIDFSEYPSDIDVIVNDTTIATDVAGDGTGPFETTVDLSGVLDPGFNEIEVTSDSLGHIEASLAGRLTLENSL